MEINFIKLEDPDQYSITRNGEIIFIAAYNKKENIRELYSTDKVKVAEAFFYNSKWFQLVPEYSIQLLTKDNCEVLIRPNSITGQTYSFEFGGCQYFVISHIGCKYSIFREDKQIAMYQTCGVNMGPQNMLLVANDDLCVELFCLLVLYLHSDFGSEDPSTSPAFKVVMPKARFNKNWRPI